MKKTLKKLTAFLTSVLMCGVSLLDFPAGSFNISLPSWAADEGGGIYVCDHAYINGFCISCDAYQPAVQVSDKYDLDGDGATESVYEIGNAGQLYWFAKFANQGNGNEESEAVLTDDISVNANVIDENGELNSGSFRNWTPIGNEPACSFNGFFDGQNHEISGLHCVDLNDIPVGLFGITVGYGRSISNVKIVDSYFFGTGYSGGICGLSNHDIKNCYNEGTVVSQGNAGGICGSAQASNIENCGNSGRIVCEKNAGGIYGYGDLNYSVTNCFNNGIISGESQAGEIGGITSGGSLKNCCYNSEINGLEVIGSGAETATMDNVVGKTTAEIESGEAAYFLGDAWGQNLDNGETKQDLPVLGGAKVYQIEKYSKCDKSDTPVTAYSNTDKTQVAEHIIENGFCVNCDYLQPAVMNSNYKYEIGNAGQLYWFAKFTNESEDNSYFSAILTSDIVVNENVLNDDMELNEGTYRQWTPIGDRYSYRGVFDGNNHTISGLYYNDRSVLRGTLGFICTVDITEIKNLGIVDSYFYVNIGTRYTGGICGNSNGNIINCFSICQIEGDGGYSSNCGYGGICGNFFGNYLINCYSLSNVPYYNSGKICGIERGLVDNCYYDSETSNTRGGRTIEEFENGTVAYLLAKGSDYYSGENSWGQNLDNDEPKQKYPSLGGAKVYEVNRYTTCDKSGTPTTGYSNYDKEIYDEHIGYEENNGFCACGEYQAAVLNENGVYEIGNAGQLYWFAGLVNGTLNGVEQDLSANAVLTSDITVNENVLNENGELNEGTFRDWTPIGIYDFSIGDYPYEGIFDGNNHTISGLYLNDPVISRGMHTGLFGYSNGVISNVSVVDSYFSGNNRIAVICGWNKGTIKNCHSFGLINGGDSIGGICGINWDDAVIEDCSNTASVIGDLSYSSTFAGGICGANRGIVQNSYNRGLINSYDQVGGICGQNGFSGSTTVMVKDCYNVGTVNGEKSFGYICGYSNETVQNCYYSTDDNNSGEAVGTDEGTTTDVFGKPIAAFESGEVAYLLGGAWGQNLDNGETKQTLPVISDAKVYQVEKYTKCDKSDTPAVIYSNTNETQVPAHVIERGLCANCSYAEAAVLNEKGVYEIGNAGQLYWFAKLVNGTLDGVEQNASANAILVSDIIVNENVLNDKGELNDGTFRNWTPIGSSDYSGTFDGNNHTISGLYFNDRTVDSVGLFRRSSETAKITNVGIVDSYLNAGSTVGAMCGLNYGIIENCYNTGSVNGITKIGGICGSNGKNANIINCYNRGAVTSDSDASGICGSNGPSFSGNSSKIKNCYNTGSVEGKSVDGICYANMFKDSIIENCYYNNEILISKGTPINTGTTTNVLGKTTAEFESGEVAYLLGEAWGQNIDNGETKQSLPEFSDARVYQNRVYSKCDKSDTPVVSYSNTQAEDVVPAHSFVNGRCSECGWFENKIGESLEGYSVDLDGSIGVNFYMLLDPRVAADEKSYMQFTLPNGEIETVYSNKTLTAEVNGETYNIFTCNIAAKEMTSEIKAQMFSSDAEGQIYSFTVADYANYIIKNSSKYSSETVAMVKAMLNYGKYAKAYFDGEVLEATAEMNNVTADTLAEYKMSESGELPEGVTYYGSSLLLESKTVLRHYFKIEEGVDAESYGFSEHKGMYYYYDDESFARNLVDPSWNFRFSDYTLTYGPMSYAYTILTNHSDDKALVNLMESLYLYGKAASDYFFADAPFYLMPNSEWLEGNSRFAVYAWNEAGNKWFDCADAGDGIHFVVKNFDFSYKNVIFCRMDPDTTENNWDNRLNATVETVVPTGRNRYYRLDEGTSNNVGGSWISDSFLL